MAMQVRVVLVCLLLLGVHCITKWDFNVCRINNCNTEEINCVSDQTTCLNYFGPMREW